MTSEEGAQKRQAKMVEQSIQRWRPEVEGRVAVVTGGARGIGRAIVEGLLKAGGKVVAIDKTWQEAEDWKSRLDSAGDGMAVDADVTEDAHLDAAYEAVMERFGRTDILVNNAALVSETLFYPTGRVKTLDTTDADWEAMFKVNVFGVVKVIRRFIRPMIETGRGSIMNVLSSGILPVAEGGGYYGLRPWTVEMPYQSTKAAVMALSFYLAEEVREQGVAVNAVMPGHTRASWFDTTARSWYERGVVYFLRPVVSEHIVPITLFLGAQNGEGVTGRLYYIPDWNYDHGYGDYAAWLDRSLPKDMEEIYGKIEAVMPKYERSGVPHIPFDAMAAVWSAGMASLASQGAEKGGKGGS